MRQQLWRIWKIIFLFFVISRIAAWMEKKSFHF